MPEPFPPEEQLKTYYAVVEIYRDKYGDELADRLLTLIEKEYKRFQKPESMTK